MASDLCSKQMVVHSCTTAKDAINILSLTGLLLPTFLCTVMTKHLVTAHCIYKQKADISDLNILM